METNLLSKRDFIKRSMQYAAGTAVGVAGLNILSGNKLFASPSNYTWPLPYEKLDPKEVALQGHYLYWNDKDCGAGTFGAIVQALAAKIGEPWTNIPIETLLHGRGGGGGWGTLCGTINGGAALISLVVPKAESGALINELFGWYTTEALPSERSNQWAQNGEFAAHKFDGSLITSISGSPLCHISVSLWSMLADKKVGDLERRERCGRITADTVYKTIELLNAWKDKTFQQTWTVPSENKPCLDCHGTTGYSNVMTNMSCVKCHGDPHKSGVIKNSDDFINIGIQQNYPNPFINHTTFKIQVDGTNKTRVEIFDMRGYPVITLVDNQIIDKGEYRVEWDGKDYNGKELPSGIYFAKLSNGNVQKLIKMQLMK